MKRSAMFLALALCGSVLAPAARPRAAAEDELVLKARAFVAALAKADYAAAAKDFDATMAKVLGPAKLADLWKSLQGQMGAFKSQAAVRREKLGAFDIVLVTCEYEKGPLDTRVVFSKDGSLTGLQFVPTRPPAVYEPPKYADPALFEEREVTVGGGEWALPGTLTVPKGKGPFPALVLVHGSGPNDRDETLGPNKPFKDLAWGLASRGIAVLRYEKRTRQYATKLAADRKLLARLTVKEETIDDALEAVRLLKATAGIDAKRIFVLGHSLGGMLVPRIALAGKDLGIAGFVSMAGLTRPVDETILRQMTYLLSLDGSLSVDDTKQLDAIRADIARIKALRDSDAGSADMIMHAPPGYWLDLRAYDPPSVALKMTSPLLVLQGSRDYQVTVDDFDNWKKALAGKPGVEFKLYEKLNHLFFEGQGLPTPDEYTAAHASVAEYVVADIAAFIAKH